MSKPTNPTYNLPSYAPNYEYLPSIVQKNICPRGSGAPYVTLPLYLCLYNIDSRINAYNDSGKTKPIRKSLRTLALELDLPKTAISNGLRWLEAEEWIDIEKEKNTSVIYLNIDKIRPLIFQHWKRLQNPQPSSATSKPKPFANEDKGDEPQGDYGAPFPMSSIRRQ